MKKFQFKVYDTDGNYVRNWNDASLNVFLKKINGGLGDCEIELARTIDNWNDNNDLGLNYKVEIWVSDTDNIAGVKVYVGYVSRIKFVGRGTKQRVIVVLLGYVSKLALDFYKNGTTTTISETSKDPSVMLKNIIARLQAENTELSFIGYSVSSIELTGLSVDYDFVSLTYLDAINACLKLAPANWYWFLDADSVLNFKSKPTEPTHNFIIGGNVSEYEIVNDIEDVRNGVLIWDNAALYRYLKDSQSISNYGRRIEKMVKANVNANAGSMDAIANAFLGANRDPKSKCKLTIVDNNEYLNGYDIESIQPGQTCRISGLPSSVANLLNDNLVIVSVEYYSDYAIVEVENWQEDKFEDMFDKVNKNLDEKRTIGIPSSYTEV